MIIENIEKYSELSFVQGNSNSIKITKHKVELHCNLVYTI